MPLLDHFHGPLYPQRSWESFHSRWANSIADELQKLLPPRYFTEVQIHLGSQVEADVVELEDKAQTTDAPIGNGVAVETWAPPKATIVLPAVFPDDIAVLVKDEEDDARVVAVIELVSPRNKGRAQSRRAFAAKCIAFLQKGIGLIMVDIVTRRSANLHNEVARIMKWDTGSDSALYAVAYRPVRHEAANQIEAWIEPLHVGSDLPTLPLALRGNGVIPVNLEASYTEARERSRI